MYPILPSTFLNVFLKLCKTNKQKEISSCIAWRTQSRTAPPVLVSVERVHSGISMVRYLTRLFQRLRRKGCFVRFQVFYTCSPAPTPPAPPLLTEDTLLLLLAVFIAFFAPAYVLPQDCEQGITALFSRLCSPLPRVCRVFTVCVGFAVTAGSSWSVQHFLS